MKQKDLARCRLPLFIYNYYLRSRFYSVLYTMLNTKEWLGNRLLTPIMRWFRNKCSPYVWHCFQLYEPREGRLDVWRAWLFTWTATQAANQRAASAWSGGGNMAAPSAKVRKETRRSFYRNTCTHATCSYQIKLFVKRVWLNVAWD